MAGGADLAEQPVRQAARCPNCGGEPLPDRVTHTLSAIGYTHDDQRFICADCSREWTAGVPIGEFDRPGMAADLECGSCGAWMLVHRVRSVRGESTVTLHLKCPESDCHTFGRAQRSPDEQGIALVGYPQITGRTEGCDAYGYPDRDTADDATGD